MTQDTYFFARSSFILINEQRMGENLQENGFLPELTSNHSIEWLSWSNAFHQHFTDRYQHRVQGNSPASQKPGGYGSNERGRRHQSESLLPNIIKDSASYTLTVVLILQAECKLHLALIGAFNTGFCIWAHHPYCLTAAGEKQHSLVHVI